MALRINKQLTDRTGDAVAPGSIVKFETTFPIEGNEVYFKLYIYKSQALYDAGASPYYPKEIPTLYITDVVTEEEYSNLSPIAIHQKLRAKLEELPDIGAGVVEIVT